MTPSNPVIDAFVSNIRQVEDLLTIDELILEIPIRLLEKVVAAHDRMKLQNPQARVDKTLLLLRNLRQNESLESRFQAVRNQCVVLATSHFASAVRQLFIDKLTELITDGEVVPLLEEKLTLSLAEILKLSSDIPRGLAESVANKKEISFQDMRSIARAYKDFLGETIPRDSYVNDIVVAHACRHALVHSGGLVDKKLLAQIRDATPRHLGIALSDGDHIEFGEQDVRTIGTSMTLYLNRLMS